MVRFLRPKTTMRVHAQAPAYVPPPALPSEGTKSTDSAAFQQLLRQTAGLQQEGEQPTAAPPDFREALTVPSNPSGLARWQNQDDNSSADGAWSESRDLMHGLSSGLTGQLIDVMA